MAISKNSPATGGQLTSEGNGIPSALGKPGALQLWLAVVVPHGNRHRFGCCFSLRACWNLLSASPGRGPQLRLLPELCLAQYRRGSGCNHARASLGCRSNDRIDGPRSFFHFTAAAHCGNLHAGGGLGRASLDLRRTADRRRSGAPPQASRTNHPGILIPKCRPYLRLIVSPRRFWFDRLNALDQVGYEQHTVF